MARPEDFGAVEVVGARPEDFGATEIGVPDVDRGAYYADKAKKGVANLVSTLGMPADAINAAVGAAEHFIRRPERIAADATGGEYRNAFPVEYPFMGTRNFKDATENLLGVQNVKDPSKLDKVGGMALEIGIPSLPFMARNVAQAPHKIPAIVAEGASLFGGSAGGVLGEEAGSDMDESFGTTWGKPVGEALGILGGSILPALGPTGFSNLLGMVTSKFNPTAKKEAATRAAGKILGPAMESELNVGQNIAQADDVTAAINAVTGGKNFQPTIAGRTGAKVVQELEHGIVGASPERLSQYAGRKAQNQTALNQASDVLLGNEKAVNLPRQAQSRLSKSQRMLEEKLAAMERQGKTIASQTEGRASQDVGESLRDQYWKTRKGVKGEFDRAYEDLYAQADAGGVNVDMSKVDDIAQNIAKADQNVYQDMPTTFGKLKSRAGGTGAPFAKPGNAVETATNALARAKEGGPKAERSFREFHSLWKEVNREYGKAARANDTQKMEYLKQLKAPLEEQMAKLEGGLGEISQSFKKLNQDYGSRYAKTFKEGIGGRVADVGRFGASMDDAKVVEKFFTPDGLDDFAAIYGADKDANRLLNDGVMGLFAKSAVDEVTGQIKPGAAESFLRRNAEALKKLPELDATLRDAVKTNAALSGRSERLRKAQKTIGSSELAKVAGTEDIGALLDKASKSPKEMKQLFAIAKTPQQRIALARSLADELPKIAQREGSDSYSYLMRNEATLKPIIDRLGKNHWNNLKTIAGGQTIQSRTEVPGRVDIKKGADPVTEAIGSSARSLTATYMSILRGRTQPHSEAAQLFARFGIKQKEKMMDRIMNEAIYDPELADAIVKMQKGAKSGVVANKFANYIDQAIYRAAAEGGEE